jgi:FKBP-type peptidyl-prolyl cis-trans isomerase FklB
MKVNRYLIKGKVKVLPFYLFTLLLLFASCKEEDDVVEEFPNWPETNDAFFSSLVADVQAKKAAGETNWDLIVSYSKPTEGYSPQASDYIVVEKMESATGDNLQSPMLSDSVEVHYVGRLIPSADKYRNLGMEFDRSHSGEWNPQTHCYNFYPEKSTPAKFAVNRVVNGFSTAVMHMHRGDHWIVYIPYQLGYGTVVRGSIPAGSTLIFDLRMEDFWTKTKGDRN